MTRDISLFAPLLVPFGGAETARVFPPAAVPGERPTGLPPRFPTVIHGRSVSIYYDLAHIDRDGRLSIRRTADAMGWHGEPLDAAYRDACIVVTRSGTGKLRLSATGRLRLPMALRRRTGLAEGEPALLAADAEAGELIICPPSGMDSMIATWRSGTGESS